MNSAVFGARETLFCLSRSGERDKEFTRKREMPDSAARSRGVDGKRGVEFAQTQQSIIEKRFETQGGDFGFRADAAFGTAFEQIEHAGISFSGFGICFPDEKSHGEESAKKRRPADPGDELCTYFHNLPADFNFVMR